MCFTRGQIIYENKNFGTNSDGCATFFLEIDYRRINIQEKRSGPSEIMGHIQLWISYISSNVYENVTVIPP